jgi:MFS family permease
LLLKDFGVSYSALATTFQIFGIAAVVGFIVWPWLADKYGRRTVLAINIAAFSLAMPIAGSAPNWITFVAVYAIIRFTLSGEWGVGAPLVAETWPAKYRGVVLGVIRAGYALGTAFAGLLTAYVAAGYGWRAVFYISGLVAVLAIYIRFLVPESPSWVRAQDRKDRISSALAAKRALSQEDIDWLKKISKPKLNQLFLPDTRRATILVTVVCSGIFMSVVTIIQFMPLYLSETHGWSTQQFGIFFTWWGLVGIPATALSGYLSDLFGRRLVFAICLLAGAVAIAFWTTTTDTRLIWIVGMVCSFAYTSAYGPLGSFASELYPTRVRATGTGFSFATASLVAYVFYPTLLLQLRQLTGSFAICFFVSSAILAVLALIIWFLSPESAGKELNEISE